MAANPEYKRLPGRGRRGSMFSNEAAAYSRLWLASDHLLCVDKAYFSERYRRFFFRDIQAVILRKTSRGSGITIVLSILLVFSLLPTISQTDFWFWFWLTIAMVFLGCLLINILVLGPTCRCDLRTAVQTVDLPSLRRVRQAEKVLARLRPMIAAAQGEFPVAETEDQPPVIVPDSPTASTSESTGNFSTLSEPPA